MIEEEMVNSSLPSGNLRFYHEIQKNLHLTGQLGEESAAMEIKKEQLQKPNKKNASITKNDSTSLGNFHSVCVEEHTFQGDDFKVIKEDILNVLLMRITDDISCLPKFQGNASKDNIKTILRTN